MNALVSIMHSSTQAETMVEASVLSVSFLSQISAISSNSFAKAKPKLPFNLQSTYQPLCLRLDQVLQRIKEKP